MERVGYLAHGTGALAPPEPDMIGLDCGCDVPAGELVYEYECRTACESCMTDYVRYEKTTEALADALGARRVVAI